MWHVISKGIFKLRYAIASASPASSTPGLVNNTNNSNTYDAIQPGTSPAVFTTVTVSLDAPINPPEAQVGASTGNTKTDTTAGGTTNGNPSTINDPEGDCPPPMVV